MGVDGDTVQMKSSKQTVSIFCVNLEASSLANNSEQEM